MIIDTTKNGTERELQVTTKLEEVYAKATARGVKKIAGLKFGDRLKVKECGWDTIYDGYITFIDYEMGHIVLQMQTSHVSLHGIDDWQIV